MTKNINLHEIEDTEYKYYEPKPKDEKEFVASHKPTRRDVPNEDGKDVFRHIKAIKKDKTRPADPEGFDKVNRGGNLGKEVRAMELPESDCKCKLDRIRNKAKKIYEGTDDAAPPQPVASDNPQTGNMQAEPDPKPSSADPMGPIRIQLKNIALAAADIYDGVSEDTTMEPWMTQTISKAEGEFSKIIEQFRKKSGAENQVSETYEQKKDNNPQHVKPSVNPEVAKTPIKPKRPFGSDKISPTKPVEYTMAKEAFDPPNPKLVGDHKGNPTYVYPIKKVTAKPKRITDFPLVSPNLSPTNEDMSISGNEGSSTHEELSNLSSSPNGRVKIQGKAFPIKPGARSDTRRETRYLPNVTPKSIKILASPVYEQEVIFESSSYKKLSKLHDALIKAGYKHLHTKHSNPEETEYSTGRSEYHKIFPGGTDQIVVQHSPGDAGSDPGLHRIIRTKTTGQKPEDFSLSESIHINEVLTMSDDQMSRYANYIALHESRRKGLTESARRDAMKAMGPAAKEVEHEPEDENLEHDEEGNAKGGSGRYVDDLRKVPNTGGMVKHGDGKMHHVSRVEAKRRVADILSKTVAHGAREALQNQHFNNPPAPPKD